jgi:hypothetical protein
MKLLFAALALTSAIGAADLPVRHVILYKHGLGFFERSGLLGPGESARLDFKAADMNDVLKTLTIEEKGGGKISGLRYDSSEPLDRKLGEFPFQIGAAQPLAALLDQFKGARIELKFGNESVAGAIVGALLYSGEEKRPDRESITLLMENGDIRTFDLRSAAGVRFLDPKLQQQFRDYLLAVSSARSKERRSIYIDSTDAKDRQITAGYMTPMPIWKSTYRLILGQESQPLLEGWAIVDNTTGEDWINVNLALVSGRPISFVSQLYAPRYIARSAAELPEETAQSPVVYEGTLNQMDKLAEAPMAGLQAGVGGNLPRRFIPPTAVMKQALKDEARVGVASSVASVAAARELGELFEYRIPAPVTIRKSESAMLPFLQQRVDARRLLIYSDQTSAHPMNAAELKNTTGKTLDGGPITVYDANAYAGEALVETVKAGDKRLISYGVDLGTRITTEFDSKGDLVREVHVRRGILTTRTAEVTTKTYTAHNVDQKAKTLIIEHPVRPEYRLLTIKPAETTRNAWRFEVKLAAGATEKFPVTEERVYETSTALANLTPEVLLSYIRNKNLTDAARAQLERIADRKRNIAAAEREIRETEEQIASMVRDQDRIRQNVNSLNQVSGQQQQVQAYARQLATQEAQLAAMRDRVAESQRRRTSLQAEIDNLIEKLQF